jgi:hypothetical protein
MIKISNGFADFCIPYSEKQNEMLEVLNEMIEGELIVEIH